LDEENDRIQREIENFKNSLVEIDNDLDREKSITIDANSNEKRLKEEKSDLINIDTKYYDTEKKSNDDLFSVKDKLKNNLENVKNLISQNQNDDAIKAIEECKNIIEEYAESYSKNQNIKNDSIKRKERIKIIDTEIESWKNLLENSYKSIKQLNVRRQKSSSQLNLLENKPNTQAEKKGQLTENLRLSEIEKEENEKLIEKSEKKSNALNLELSEIRENSIEIRERKASSTATIDGLSKRRIDLLERIENELNLAEKDVFEFSNLKDQSDLPDALTQEELLDEKKRERDKLGSVNLRADEETSKYEIEIKKMEKDRSDLVTAIVKT